MFALLNHIIFIIIFYLADDKPEEGEDDVKST